MGSAWMDELWAGDDHLDDEGNDDFYCPYTSGTECPIIAKGWQPQELCDALKCNQLKLVQHKINKKRRDKAA